MALNNRDIFSLLWAFQNRILSNNKQQNCSNIQPDHPTFAAGQRSSSPEPASCMYSARTQLSVAHWLHDLVRRFQYLKFIQCDGVAA